VIRRRVCLLLALLAVWLPGAGFADGAVTIRQGRHGEMGRLVFDFTGAETYRSQRDGGVLTLAFAPAEPIAAITPHIPGVETMQGGSGVVRLQLAAGAEPRIYRLGDRVVVDVTLGDARTAKDSVGMPAAASPRAARASAPLAATRPAQAKPSATGDARPLAAKPAAISPTEAAQPAIDLAAPAIAAAPVASGANQAATAEIVSFTAQPGAAAFRRGDRAIVVFDTSEIPDLTSLQSAPLFAGASLVSLQNAQVITIPLPVADALALTPVAGGWQIAAVPAQLAAAAPLQNAASAVEFPMQSANESIIMSDPLTGGDLLVGTVTQGNDAADFTESGPGYAVLPAWLGVVVLPEADDLGLNASLKGFELVSAAPNGLPLGAVPASAMAASTAADLGEAVSLPRGETAELYRRMIADQRAVALLPQLGRLNAQITLAQDLVALGMGPEAAGVLSTAVLENPAAQDNGRIAGLRAIADVLSHRSRNADFSAPGIVPSPELAFWRAAGALDQGQIAPAISGLIDGLPRFETYPQPLRDTMSAQIAEALADNGKLQAASQLVDADPGNERLDLARAKILEHRGQAKAALAMYQMLAHRNDDRVSAIAEDRAVELQLAAGRLSDAAAADALDAQLFDWRAPEHERHLRLRIAALQAMSGEWPQAFTALQSARALFPDDQAGIDALRGSMFLQMLRSPSFAQLPPIEAVAVLQQNQDLIPPGAASTQVINLLAQRLAALDLPGAAAPMLSHLIANLPPGPVQASLGATLAQIDLDAGSPVAALADLSQTQADNLPAALAAQRGLLAAKAQAQGGNAIAAVNGLAPAAPANLAQAGLAAGATTPALDTQAQIAEQSGQWPQAEQALSGLVRQSVPAAGPISNDQENLLLRLATAAAHNNDSLTLASLSAQYGGRVGTDAAGQMFQTLTAPPLTGDQGLNQALHEIAQLQALPAMLDAVAAPLKPPPPPTGPER
jgi:hypothetical protein